MHKPSFNENWPILWKECYKYDCLEMFGSNENPGYRYAYQQRFQAILNFVYKYLPVGSRLMDIAAAQGNFSLVLAEKGYKIIWNDLRNELVDYVKMKYEQGDINYYRGNCFDIELEELLDGVVITEIIEHVAHPDEFLKKVTTLVKQGGYVFMSTPLGSYFLNRLPKFSECKDPSQYESIQFKPNSDGHIFLLHKEEIYQLAKNAGLEIIEWKANINPLTSGNIKLHLLLKILPPSFVMFVERLSQKLPWVIRRKIFSNISVVLKKI